MASNITLSAGVRQNLLALQNTAALLSSTQNRLATGKKVNTALDNPTNFFTSSALSARASDLSSLLDSMSNGIQTIQAANNGLTSITNTVNSMQATITQARQDSSWKSTSYTLGSVGTGAAKQLSISGGSVTGTVNVALNSVSTSGTKADILTTANYSTSVPTAATSPVLTGGSSFAALDMTTGDETYAFNINVDGTDYAVTLGTGDNTGGGTTLDQAEVIAGINSDLASSDVRVRQNSTDNTKIEFYRVSGSAGAAQSLTIDFTPGTGGTTPSALTSLGFTNGQNASGVDANDLAFTVNDGTTTANVLLTAANGDTLAHAVDAINTQLAAQGISGVEAYDNTAGKLGIREKNFTALTVTLGGADAGIFASASATGTATTTGTEKTVDQLVTAINADTNLSGKVKATNDGGKLNIQNLSTEDLSIIGATSTTINGGTGSGNTTSISGNAVRKNLITQFNDLRSQLDKLADDASFNGINLLRGDTLKLVFNETATSSISIASQNQNGINSSVLGIGAADATEFSSNSALDARQSLLHDALTQLRSQSSAFGSNLSVVQNRQDFTKSMINTLQTGSDNLTLADSNEEAANLLALQTRQQLSTTALSLAAQSDQAVLRLF